MYKKRVIYLKDRDTLDLFISDRPRRHSIIRQDISISAFFHDFVEAIFTRDRDEIEIYDASTFHYQKKKKKMSSTEFYWRKNYGFLFRTRTYDQGSGKSIVIRKKERKKKGKRRKTIVKERKVVPPVRTTTSPRIAYETLGNKVGNPATKGAYRQPTGVT